MMTLKQLEKTIIEHLQESGQIKADLSWLKKAHWIQFAATITFISTAVISIFMYLLKKQ